MKIIIHTCIHTYIEVCIHNGAYIVSGQIVVNLLVHRNGQEANAQPVSEAAEIVEEVSVAVVDSRDEQCLFQGRIPRRVLVVASLGVRCLYVCKSGGNYLIHSLSIFILFILK